MMYFILFVMFVYIYFGLRSDLKEAHRRMDCAAQEIYDLKDRFDLLEADLYQRG